MGFLSRLIRRRNSKHRHCACHQGVCTRKSRHLRPLRLNFEPLEERQLLSVAPLGDEWLVNSFTGCTQELADTGNAVAALPDGGYVASWTSVFQDGDSGGIYAQRFGADGVPRGAEYRVNATTAGNQMRSSVAAAADGSSVVVWQSFGQDGSGYGIYGQRYDANGQAVGNEFLVNVTTDGNQESPTVTCLSGGGFVVVWDGKGSGDSHGIFGRRFDANGSPISSEFLINTETAHQQKYATAATLPDGGFLAAWQSHGGQDGDGTGIYAQRFDAYGQAIGNEFLVNATTDDQQQYPAIGVAADGQFTIAWQSKHQDGDGWGVFAQRYAADGQLLGGEFQVNTTSNNNQEGPTVAYNDHGGFAIAWNGRGDGDNKGIFVREFGTDGAALGGESLVNVTTGGTQEYASIVASSSGYVTVWSGRGDGDYHGVFLRRLGSAPVTSGIDDQDIRAGRVSSSVELWSAFEDAENADDSLTYAVIGNSNPELFSSVTIDPATGRLVMVFAVGVVGAADLTVRATDPGGLSIETTFNIEVAHPEGDPVLYWFPQGGSNVWSTSVANWNDDPDGWGNQCYWVNNGYSAIFQDYGEEQNKTVTVSGTITAESITFWGTDFLVQSNTITLTGTGGHISSTGTGNTISSVIAGSVGLTKDGSGTLILSGNNTYTGGTTLAAGTLSLGSTGAINSTGTISFTGGALQYTASNTTDYSSRFSTASNQAYKIDTNGQSVTLASNLISSGGSLTKLGEGTLTVTGTNTYTGNTTVNGGILQAPTTASLPGYGTSGKVVLNSGGTMAVNVGGAGEWSTANVQTLISNASKYGGYVGIDTTNAASDVTYSNAISGNMGVRKLGDGTLILSGNNSYTGGTKVTDGTLQLGHANALGYSDYESSNDNLTIEAGGTVDLHGYNASIGSLIGVTGAVLTDNSATSGTTTLTLHLNVDSEYAGTIEDGDDRQIALTVENINLAATQTLSGAYSKKYTGGTTISEMIGNGTGGLNIKDGIDFSNFGPITVIGCGKLWFTGSQSLTGTGEILLEGHQEWDFVDGILYGGIIVGGPGESSPTTLTVGPNVLIHGYGRITKHCANDAIALQGAIRADEDEKTLMLDVSCTNAGVLATVGSAILARSSGYLKGSGTAYSSSEASLAWSGLTTGGSWTYAFEGSTDGENYFTIAECNSTDSTAMLAGLPSGESYYLRMKATNGTATEIYDAGMVTTLDASDPNVPDDSGGWYQISSIRGAGLNEDCPQSHLLLPPNDPEESGAYLDSLELSSGVKTALGAPDAQIFISGTTSTPELGETPDFKLDTSWYYSSSPQAAFMKAVQGLVTDGSQPTVSSSGAVQIYHVTYWHDRGIEGLEELLYEAYTFNTGAYPSANELYYLGSYPSGGYSSVSREVCCLIAGSGSGGPPCTTCCGGPGGGPGGGPAGGGPGCGGGPSPTGAAATSAPAIDGTGGATCGRVGLTYDSRLTSDSGFGPGWSDADEYPTLQGGSQNFVVSFGTQSSFWFDAEQDGSYTARYGAKQTLVHDATNDLYVLTNTDGTRYEFHDAEQTVYPRYSLYRIVSPDGGTTVITDWWDTEQGIDANIIGRMKTVEYKTTPNGQACQKRDFTYSVDYTYSGSEITDCRVRVETVTLSEYDGSNWDNVRKMTFDYYGDSESYGSSGDLKTIVTQQWNATTEQWTGDDTYYYRYYTGEYDSATNPGYAHAVKRVLLPNTFAKLTADQGNPFTVSEAVIANYTCTYFEYDADRRVAKKTVFGETNQSTFVNTLSTNADGYNTWKRKSVETRLDGTTTTTYTNYIEQTLLTDLYDDASGTHTLSYNRYDADGRLILTADSSAFTLSGGKYYDDSLPDLVDYASDSPYLSNTAGLFNITTYYASTTPGIDEDTAGGVKGYAYQSAVACGETAARLSVGSVGGPILVSSQNYFARTVGDDMIYPTASYTTYSNEDGSGVAVTEYAYTWYANSFQIQEQTTTLPVVSEAQNGSGAAATTKQYFDSSGNLRWTLNELGRATYYEYSSLTGRLVKTIDDIDDATADGLSLTIPGGWTLPASGGVNAVTEYEYDAFGRVTQTLGPVHTADVSGTPTSVRTATWTVYLDAVHETRTAQGYALAASPYTETIAGPISIQKTDRDGRTTEQIQAAYAGTVANLVSATIAQSDYTAWTTYQYSKTRMISMRTYDNIPSTGVGTAGVNYDETAYGYETFGVSTRKGRQNRTVSPDGTITRVVLDARGNVIETWLGTNDTGATDADPTGGSAAGNNMVKVSSATFDADGNVATSTDALNVSTHYTYDFRNRLTETCQNYDDGTYSSGTPDQDITTCYTYDNRGHRLTVTDVLNNMTSYAFDSLGRQYRVTQPDPDGQGALESPVTNYFYDDVGNLLSLVDPVGNATSWVYDGLRRKIEETNDLDDTRYFEYDAVGEVIEKTDRDERVTTYEYDGVGRIVAEKWWNSTPAVIYTCEYTYDAAGRLQSVEDDAVEYSYTYDDVGRVLTETQDFADAPTVVLSYQYDAVGRRTQTATTVGSAADAVTHYTYDYLGRAERIEQYANSGNAVSEKRIDLTYNGASSEYDAITYYNDLDGGSGNLVMTATYDYDDIGRLTDLSYTDSSSTTIRDFSWTYNGAGWITSHDSDLVVGGQAVEDVTAYSYDNLGQLLGADYAAITDESFTYDENGNRVTANGETYTTGDNNQTTGDGTYTYVYDDEGNTTFRYVDEDTDGQLDSGDTDITEYEWDHHNRLTEVAHKALFGQSIDWKADYEYDALNRRIASLYDTDGDSSLECVERYSWLDKNVALDFIDSDGDGGTYSLDLTTRNLWGQAVDQLLAQEAFDDGSKSDVIYFVRDNLGSTRSLVNYLGQIAATYSYDTYGNVTVRTGTLADTRYLYTCQEYDAATSLYYYDARWYDFATGKFVSEDPIGYKGGINLFEYVNNSSINRTDPSGQQTAGDYFPGGNIVPPGYYPPGAPQPPPQPDPPSNSAWYGNYCGPGGSGIPIDDLDRACQQHDKCYEKIGAAGIGGVIATCPAARICDSDLCIDALRANCNGDIKCIIASVIVASIFCENARR